MKTSLYSLSYDGGGVLQGRQRSEELCLKCLSCNLDLSGKKWMDILEILYYLKMSHDSTVL